MTLTWHLLFEFHRFTCIFNFEELLNFLPDVTLPEFVDLLNIETNNEMMCVYLGSLVRSIISFHNLIDNKVISVTKNDFLFFTVQKVNLIFDECFYKKRI